MNSAYIKTYKAALVTLLSHASTKNAICIYFHVYFCFVFLINNNAGCIKHVSGPDVAHEP
jgi:hypothetical protein